MRTVGVALATMAIAIVVADSATATTPPECTCTAFPIVADSVGRTSVAFVGTPITSEDIDDARLGPVTRVRVEVDVPIKGELPSIVDVYTDEVSDRCGVALHVGVGVGIVAQVDGVQLRVRQCGDVVRPSELIALQDDELPEPGGSGPVAGLVAARAGPAGLIAVDAQFLPLGYVAVEEDPIAASDCPSGATVAVLGTNRTKATVTLVDLATLSVVSSTAIPADAATTAQRGAAEVFCITDDGAATVFLRGPDGGTLWTVTAAGEVSEMPLLGIVDVHPAALSVFVLSSASLSPLGPDGAAMAALATFAPDAAALSMVLDGWDLVVAVSNDLTANRFVSDELRRYSLLDASMSSVILPAPVPAPNLRTAPGGVVIASAYGGETWLARDGQTIEVGTPNVWPAGDGFASWNEGTTGATAHLDGDEVGALEFASNPTFVLPLDAGVGIDPESPGAQAMPMVPTPGRVLTPPTTAATPAPAATTPSTVASTTTVAPTAPATEPAGGSDLGTSTIFGAAIVAGVALVLIAAAIALRRRDHPATDPPPPTLR